MPISSKEEVDEFDTKIKEGRPERGANRTSGRGGRKTARAPRVRLVPFNEIKLGIECRYLVHGLLPRTGIVVVWGPPKCGKSFWLTDIAMHVALGRDYRGRKVTGGPVIYCAFEGAFGFGARIEAFRQRFLAEDDGSDVPFFLEPLRIDLVRDHVELIDSIKGTLGLTHPAVVVLDTLNRSLRGSENDDEDMSAYIQAADAIREALDCAVIIVHHCGIHGTRPRGHTSLAGAADAQLAVRRDAAGSIIVKVECMKDAPEGAVIASRLESIEVGLDEEGMPITSCVVMPAAGDVDVKESLEPGQELSKAAKIALSALEAAIEELGEVAPASDCIPEGVRVISVGIWRQYAYQRGISNSKAPRARQQAFQRATNLLLAAKVVSTWDNYVWRAPGVDC